tara:strand:- start:279 stop:464 length:186 start_codon:yes stop_codon:yes gene_type:complete
MVDQVDQAAEAQIGHRVVHQAGLEPPAKVEVVVRVLETMQVAEPVAALLSQVGTETLTEVV